MLFKIIKAFPVIILLLYILIVYRPFLFHSNLPIPADTIVGLYHPWRDFFAKDNPSGIPFKNFQVTDSVRQQYPWRKLGLELLAKQKLPLWNPYVGAGMPLLANLQSAVFYPLNLLYLLPIAFGTIWSAQVLLQTFLGGIFMWLYLRSLKIHPYAQTLGVLSWIGSGFFVAWLEWNTTVHVVIWLPLILLCVDKIFSNRKKLIWTLVLAFSLLASFFAGYLQPFFYVFVVSSIYFFARLIQTKRYVSVFFFLLAAGIFLILAFPQWSPTIQYINLSARSVDQNNWTQPGWFIPLQNLAQFVAPDYFGNPATLNYTGIWNYQEFIGYIGQSGLIFVLVALFFRRDKKTLFFSAILILALVFALPTTLAKLPFQIKIPYLSTSQPSRLMFIIDFSLAVLASLGLDLLLKSKLKVKSLLIPTVLLGATLGILWLVANKNNQLVSIRNLYFPIIIFITILGTFLTLSHPRLQRFFPILVLVICLVDLSRFAVKFEPFSDPSYLYPETQITSFLKQKSTDSQFRFVALDDRIFPPNFSVSYRIQQVSVYDPLYVKRYGEFIRAVENNSPVITGDLGFNRIIVPKNFQSKFFDLLGIKYLLTFGSLSDPRFKFIFSEGQTNLFENTHVLPRTFFVRNVDIVVQRDQVLDKMFSANWDPATQAIVEGADSIPGNEFSVGTASILNYQENSVLVETDNVANGFLVLTDQYYPGWRVTIDNQPTKIYITDYTFRGILVPAGKHQISFDYQ